MFFKDNQYQLGIMVEDGLMKTITEFTMDQNATGALILATNAYSTPPVWTYPPNSCSSALQTQPPSSISSNTNSICQGQSTTLTANNSIGTTYWFTNGCGTTGQFATGSSVNVTPNSTTTYYARNYANGLWSSTCASTTITVTNGPTSTHSTII
jgi:hypothetical protein